MSEARQAQYLTRAFELIEQDPYVEVALWYGLRNNYWANDADEPEARYGLLRVDYSRKPAFHAFAAYANGSGDPRPAKVEEPGSDAPVDPGESTQPEPEVVPTAVKLKVKGKRKMARVRGRVINANRGTVRLIVERKRGGRWSRTRKVASKVDRRGRYGRKVRLGEGVFRIAARYAGTDRHKPSRSPYKRLRAR